MYYCSNPWNGENMPKQQAVHSSTKKALLSGQLERLTMEEQQAEQDLRKTQEEIKRLEWKN